MRNSRLLIGDDNPQNSLLPLAFTTVGIRYNRLRCEPDPRATID
jgi:hypothetical protein